MIYVIIIFRIHYTIDIFMGMLVGHYIFIIIDKYKKNIDKLVLLPYNKIL